MAQYDRGYLCKARRDAIEKRYKDEKRKQQGITFSFVGIFTIPNELSTDADKVFNHGLSSKERDKARKFRHEKNIMAFRSKQEEVQTVTRVLQTYIIQERVRRATQLEIRLRNCFSPCPFWRRDKGARRRSRRAGVLLRRRGFFSFNWRLRNNLSM